MARITRSSIINYFQDLLGLQSGSDAIPVYTGNNIQPVVIINPLNTTIAKSAVSGATGNVTIYTTPADKDFYLTFCSLSLTKNVTNDNTSSAITMVMNGLTFNILPIKSETLTAGTFFAQQSFPFPIKVDRGTPIILVGPFTVGACTKTAQIGGYILE